MESTGQVFLEPTICNLCPLCNSEIKKFFINLNEKMLMCENTNCEYPFGYEPLQFFKENNEIEPDVEVMSIGTGISLYNDANQTASVTGNTACWSEINRLNKANSSEGNADFSNKHIILNQKTSPGKPVDIHTIDESIKNNIKAISTLTTKLSNDKPILIHNRQMIENLQSLEMCSRAELLKPQEKLQCKPGASTFNGGELKIDISSGVNEMSNITIDIKNFANC